MEWPGAAQELIQRDAKAGLACRQQFGAMASRPSAATGSAIHPGLWLAATVARMDASVAPPAPQTVAAGERALRLRALDNRRAAWLAAAADGAG